VADTISKVKKADGKLFLFTAMIQEKEIVDVTELISYGQELHPNLVRESIQNVHDLIMKKYGKLLANTNYSIDAMKERHSI